MLDADRGRELLSLKGHKGPIGVTVACFSPNGERIVSTGVDPLVKVWNADRGQEVLLLQENTGGAFLIRFSPDGKRLIGNTNSDNRLVWEVSSGCLLPKATDTLPPGSDGYLEVLSPDHRLKATTDGSTIRLVDQRWQLQAQGQERDFAERLAGFDPGWHRSQAEGAAKDGQWFAASFHLDQLLRHYPWDAELQARRAQVLAHQGKTIEASTHLMHAIFLNSRVPLSSSWFTDKDARDRAPAKLP